MNERKIQIIGAGLAGSEAAWQVVRHSIPVTLYEMRPSVMTKAHCTGLCAELVCSNSLRGNDLTHAVGLLKRELRSLGSLIIQAADFAQVPAGDALAVDREVFSAYIDNKLKTHPLVEICTEEIKSVPTSSPEHPLIVASGPLTSNSLADAIETLTGETSLAFYDAISPIVILSSIDQSKAFFASRYDKGGGRDYLNIPLSKGQYISLIEDVRSAEKFTGHEDVDSKPLPLGGPPVAAFEGCMPIEDMVERGPDTLRFGPLKAAGLTDPRSGLRPYAVLQLRQDDKSGKLWSMVGMQTRMKQGEQMRIFRSLPGLEKAEFVRLGSVHRNTFINSPKHLSPTLEFRGRSGLFFAGQITGVEGYVESTAGGLLAGINAARMAMKEPLIHFPDTTAIGALMAYISEPTREDFQPMNVSFGLMPRYLEEVDNAKGGKRVSKKERRIQTSEQALEEIQRIAQTIEVSQR